MTIHNDGMNVETVAGIILWDGISNPETKDNGAVVHSLKIAIGDVTDPEWLATQKLNAGIFKGNMPAGGEWPVREIDMSKFADDAALLQGRMAINANTRRGTPPVFDAAGKQVSAMQVNGLIYPGAVVKLLIHAYDFDNKSKGIAFGLDAIQSIDATAPRLSVGGGMSATQAGAMFGAAGQQAPAGTPAPPPTAGVPAPPPTGPVMLPAAQGATYEAMIAKGWTDALLLEHGMMAR